VSEFNRESVLDIRDEDRLPWLEAVDNVDSDDHVSTGKLVALSLAGLLAIGAVVGGVYLMKSTPGPTGTGEVIAAPSQDYKSKADTPGGMTVEGQGDSAFAASEGAQPSGQIDTGATTEAPAVAAVPSIGAPPVIEAEPVKAPAAPKPMPAAKPAPAPKPVATAAVPKPSGPLVAPPPASPVTTAMPNAPEGSMVQLGAYNSEALANETWTAMSKRFGYLSSATKSVQVAQVNGKRFYRLRAVAPGQAAEICGKLRVAGENCLIVR
jgi:cell division septation protein DedD